MIYGVPFIELNSKAMVPLRGYGRDNTRLSFVYKVGAGEETPPGQRLAMAPNTTINLNGATIRDAATDLDAVLMPVPTFGEMMSTFGNATRDRNVRLSALSDSRFRVWKLSPRCGTTVTGLSP